MMRIKRLEIWILHIPQGFLASFGWVCGFRHWAPKGTVSSDETIIVINGRLYSRSIRMLRLLLLTRKQRLPNNINGSVPQ